jgi:hypothetical protein
VRLDWQRVDTGELEEEAYTCLVCNDKRSRLTRNCLPHEASLAHRQLLSAFDNDELDRDPELLGNQRPILASREERIRVEDKLRFLLSTMTRDPIIPPYPPSEPDSPAPHNDEPSPVTGIDYGLNADVDLELDQSLYVEMEQQVGELCLEILNVGMDVDEMDLSDDEGQERPVGDMGLEPGVEVDDTPGLPLFNSHMGSIAELVFEIQSPRMTMNIHGRRSAQEGSELMKRLCEIGFHGKIKSCVPQCPFTPLVAHISERPASWILLCTSPGLSFRNDSLRSSYGHSSLQALRMFLRLANQSLSTRSSSHFVVLVPWTTEECLGTIIPLTTYPRSWPR